MPRLDAISASSAFIIGALLRPAPKTYNAAGAVKGGGIKASSTIYFFSSSSSFSSSSPSFPELSRLNTAFRCVGSCRDSYKDIKKNFGR
jgi:hypothetical protein